MKLNIHSRTEISGSEKRAPPTMEKVNYHLVYFKSHLEVYCLTHASSGEKKHGQC